MLEMEPGKWKGGNSVLVDCISKVPFEPRFVENEGGSHVLL
jgi:hypothetical protein